jgi:hypothetical protein
MLGPGSMVVVAFAVGETDAVALADAEGSGADALAVAEDSEDFEEHAARSAAVPRPSAVRAVRRVYMVDMGLFLR